jgi:hypothetical protein
MLSAPRAVADTRIASRRLSGDTAAGQRHYADGDHRLGPTADRILVAQLTGEARHHAKWRPLTEDEEAIALAELRALAAGRADLLAEVAGIFEGTSEGELDEPLARSAAQLCRKAGADPNAIPTWIEEGRRRSANARRPPFSGGLGPYGA